MGHTPGPWYANGDCIEADGPEGPRDVTVAVVHLDASIDADARLIAAAPELLAALKQCLPLVDAYRRASGGDGDVSAAFARSVIKKAEGTNEQDRRVD